MKRFGIIFALILALCTVAATASAMDVVSNEITNVADAKISGNDEQASLEGVFVQKINGNDFIFRDNTGEIIVSVAPEMVSEVESSLGNVARVDGHVSQDIVVVEVEASKVAISSKVASIK